MCLTAAGAAAQTNNKRTKDAARHANDAAKVFRQIMGTPDNAIPRELLEKAEAIVVFPGVKKAAFIVGGSGGQGVVSRRASGGWSQPAFLNLGGGSIGAQIGASSTDYVLLIMNQDGLKGLLEDKFEMGGEASVAAGPVGRTAAATTNATLDAGILTYSRSKGAFAGVSLKGAVIGHDNDLNQAIYGKNAHELLSGTAMTMTQMPAAVRIFPRTLADYSKR
jgi:lipid-binding SYLF domain-containing protein